MINIYPSALLVPAHPSKYRIMDPKRTTFDLIILHITSGRADPMKTAQMFAAPYLPPPAAGQPDTRPANFRKKSSAHFVVGQKPENLEPIIQCVDIGDVAIHAHDASVRSVGIEHCAREPGELGANDPGLPITVPQFQKSARLVAWLCRVAGLPIDRTHIQGHAEADPKTTHSKCPMGAPGWNWDTYMQMVEDAVSGLTF